MAAHRPSISNDTLELKHASIDVKLRKPLFSGMESVKYVNPSLKRDPTVWFDIFFQTKERYEIRTKKEVLERQPIHFKNNVDEIVDSYEPATNLVDHFQNVHLKECDVTLSPTND